MRHITILIACLALCLITIGQEVEDKPSFTEKIVLDGNIALQFGTYTLIGGNPQVGYRITDRIVAGVGYSYYLSSFKDITGTRFNDKLHGPTAFSRVLVNENIFLRSDYQSLTYILDTGSDSSVQSDRVDRLYVGGGYRSLIGGNIYAIGGAYLDILDPTAQPFFRAGIEAGFRNW